MKYQRKTEDTWQLWTNYGYGWEHECTEMAFKAIRQLRRDYRANVPSVRLRVRFKRERIVPR